MSESKPQTCSHCGATIIWKRTKNGKPHPFDLAKTFAAVKGRDGHTHCVFVNVSHFVSCPKSTNQN